MIPPGAANTAAAAPLTVSGKSFANRLRSAKFWFHNIGLSLVVAAVVTMVSNTVPPLLRNKGWPQHAR